MGPLAVHLETFFQQPFFHWLVQTSWQAGVLVCLILLAQKVVGQRLGVRGRYWLWIVLLVRLATPWAPPSPWSMYNLLPVPSSVGYGWAATPESGSFGPGLAASDDALATERHGKARPTANDAQEAAAGLGWRVHHWLREPGTVLFLFWLAGACTLAGCIVVGHVRLWRIVGREPLVTDAQVLDLLEDCRRQTRTRIAVSLVATDRIGSPALFGCLRPRLLLPRETLAELNLPELRHVFLHELAHLRRDDIAIGCLVTLLHVLHWFNPLVTLAFKRMRADRELVCDGLALSVLPPEETIAYGHTVVRQIEQLLTSRPNWTLAALSGDKARVKQRIASISGFRKETFRRSPLAFALIGLLACAGLTNPLPVRSVPVYRPARVVPTTHQDKHANIVRIHIQHRETGKYLVARGNTVTCDANAPGDAGLWEARFDEDFGVRDQIVYFYCVATQKYLRSDKNGNIAVDGLEPDETARWSSVADPRGTWILPHECRGAYLYLGERGQVKGRYNYSGPSWWDIHQLWRVKTSDDPKSNPDWRRHHVPGRDWGPPWSLQGRSR